MKFTLPDGRSERQAIPARLMAASDIATAERAISSSHLLRSAESFADLSYDERVRYRALNSTFYELVEVQGVADEDTSLILELFADNPELVNANLKRIEMDGEWGAADPFERELHSLLYDAGYEFMQKLPRKSPEAKIEVIIPAGFTRLDGFVALRRKRRLILAEHNNGELAARPKIEVDKVSTFALDIARLAELSEDAVDEVRLIVAMTMYNAVDWGALKPKQPKIELLEDDDYIDFMIADAKRSYIESAEPKENHARDSVTAFNDAMKLARALHKYGITFEELWHRTYIAERPAELSNQSGRDFIEGALKERSDLLTPASTTYYVHS